MSITCEIHVVVYYFIMICMIGHTLLHLCNLCDGLFSVCIHLFSSYFSRMSDYITAFLLLDAAIFL